MRHGIIWLLTGLPTVLAAQEANGDVDELMALLNTPVTVASKKALTTRESPGIVTLLRREEILASGAHDLQGVLALVPGFAFATDVQGVVSLGVRGNWAHEGKVLLLIDGQEMNELRYATLQFGNHFPVDQIKQIEIIRGPGSAMYGGFAELAVINVITRDGADLKGGSGSYTYGKTSDGYLARTYHLAYGDTFNGVKFSASYFGGKGRRSDGFYEDSNGLRRLTDQSQQQPGFLNLGLDAGGFSFRFIHDHYQFSEFTDFQSVPGTTIGFHGSYLDAKFTFKVSDALTFTPRVTYKEQAPWSYQEVRGTEQREVRRHTGGFQGDWNPTPTLNLVFGAEISRDEGIAPVTRAWVDGGTYTTITNQAYYAQALLQGATVNLTLGARLDRNSQFGASFVPRLALTKAWSDSHFKFLWSKAFRAPVIENIQLNGSVQPEKTTSLELEYGLQLAGGMYLSFNAFDIRIKDPIVYQFIAGGGPGGSDLETYANYAKTGSKGLELDLQLRRPWGFLHGSLSYAKASGNEVPDYAVAGRPEAALGLPQTKLTVLAGLNLGGGLSFNPSLIQTGTRYGYAYGDTAPRAFEATTLLNAFLTLQDQGWSVSVGVSNATNKDVPFLQAYTGGGSPYPGPGREVSVRLGYRL